MSRTLTLLFFEQSRLFPQDTAHWALYLWDAHAETGTLFHARKDSLASGQTVCARPRPQPPRLADKCREWSLNPRSMRRSQM
ncbi:hypothetical protein I7I48_05783 [Histoplasma ohiense]|nr:hypothetical protein I7I48_05783 [Histoplasma ohiense (nom. inval.)]